MTDSNRRLYRSIFCTTCTIIAMIVSHRIFDYNMDNYVFYDGALVTGTFTASYSLYEFVIGKLYPEDIKKLDLKYKDERAVSIRNKSSYYTLHLYLTLSLFFMYYLGMTGYGDIGMGIAILSLIVIAFQFILTKYYERTGK